MKHSELIRFLQNLLVGHKYALILRHSLNYKNILTRQKRTFFLFHCSIDSVYWALFLGGTVHHSSLLHNDVYVSSPLESRYFLFWTILLLVFIQLSIARSKLQNVLHISCLIAFAEVTYSSFRQKISSFLSGSLGSAFLLCKQYIKSLFANRNVELSSWMFVWF